MATPAQQLQAILGGFRLSKAVSVAASLGIADLLAGGPRSAAELAASTQTHEPSLYRLLSALAAAGLLVEDGERRFRLTDVGSLLRSDVPGSARDWAIFLGRPHQFEAWSRMELSIQTGGSTFEAIHGEDVWAWRAHEPEESEIFNRAMASQTGPIGPALAAAFDFANTGTVVDIGGGTGSLLAAVLTAHSNVRGIVFDQPHVVDSGDASATLAAAGVSDRCELVGGSFFDSVPAGADVYVVKSILHDWDDDACIRILRTIHAAAKPSSRLLVVEIVLGPPNEDLAGKLSDLQMLVMPGGVERSESEWRVLLHAGGWSLTEIRPILMGRQLLISEPTS
jgi:hypothetical protein